MKKTKLTNFSENNTTHANIVLDSKRKFKTRKKKGFGNAIGISVLLIIVLLIFTVLSAPLSRVEALTTYNGSNPYIRIGKQQQVAAHRAGKNLAPENTLLALEACLETNEYQVDILEFDLHMTKDEQLILLHDDTLNRTTNIAKKEAYACDYTLEELKLLNFAMDFTPNENSPSKLLGLKKIVDPNEIAQRKCGVLTFKDALDYIESKVESGDINHKVSYIIEIKDGGELGKKATDQLYTELTKRGMLRDAVIGTFESEITRYMDDKYPEIIRSSSISEVLTFYMSFLLNVDLNGVKLGFDVMQIPYDQFVINLGHKSMIDYAHKYGIAMQYWTINEPQKMQELKDAGADAIITDDPKICYDILKTK